jgi:hypothetical protein
MPAKNINDITRFFIILMMYTLLVLVTNSRTSNGQERTRPCPYRQDGSCTEILNEKGIVTGVIEKSIVNPRELEIKLKQQQGTPVPIKYY